jgi:iron complex outermembrane receptor protein
VLGSSNFVELVNLPEPTRTSGAEPLARWRGRQSLDDDPYQASSRFYVHVRLLAAWRLGAARVFVNAENLLDVRQTRYDPLVRPFRGLGGRWTTDVCAPLDGRVANVGLRLALP